LPDLLQTWTDKLTREKSNRLWGVRRWNAGRVRRVASGWSGSPAGSSSYEEGATLPCAAAAWHALVHRGGLTAGETVLLLEQVEFRSLRCNLPLLGAKAIITSSSDEKISACLRTRCR